MSYRSRQLATWLLIALIAAATPIVAAERIAFVEDRDIYLLDKESDQPVRLTEDGVPKGHLQWSPDGKLLAYINATDRSIALTQVMVIDSAGSTIMKTLVQEGSPETTTRLRGVADLRWFSADSLGLFGDYNPINCSLILLRPSTGTFLQQVTFDCRYYDVSPDGQHVVHYDYGVKGPERERRDFVYIDRDRLIYPEGPERKTAMIRVVADPQWSPDNASLAFVVRAPDKGDMRIVVADKDGVITEQGISPTFVDGVRLAWSGSSVVVAGDNLAILFDPATERWRTASKEEAAVTTTRDAREKAESDRKSALAALAKEKGWKEAAIWSGNRESPH